MITVEPTVAREERGNILPPQLISESTGSTSSATASLTTEAQHENSHKIQSSEAPSSVVAMLATASPSSVAESERGGRTIDICHLFIGNIPYATKEEDLLAFFTGYPLVSTSLPVNPRTNRPVGYGFVDMLGAEQAQRAVETLSGKQLMDRTVSVQISSHQKQDGATGQSSKHSRAQGRQKGSRNRK